MSNQNKKSNIDLDIIMAITFVCLGISLYQTGMGYSKAFGNYFASFAFAFVLVAAMFLQNRRLKDKLLNSTVKKSLLGIMVSYTLFTLASFAGNFNSFYSKFMGSELIREELEAKRDSLLQIQERAHNVLVNQTATALEAEVKSKVTQLKAQIKNEGNPGVGPQSKQILRELSATLATTFTTLRAKSASQNDLMAIADDYENIIKVALDRKLAEFNAPQSNALVTEIDSKVKSSIEAIDNSSKNTADIENGLVTLRKAVQDYKFIGNRTSTLVPTSGFKYNDQIAVDNNRLGEIDHAFKSSGTRLKEWGTWLAAFISLLIDFIPPIIIWLFLKSSSPQIKQEEEDEESQGGVTILRPKTK